MKKIIILLLAISSFGMYNAQSKIAHVNSQKLLDTLPSRKAALKQLQDFEGAGMKELQEMEADLQKSYQKYMADQATLSPVMKQYEEERLQKKQYAMQTREQELQQQMQTLSTDLNTPILKRVQKAVDVVAERKKLNYVIDESVTLYFKGGVDLTSEVLIELLKIDAEEFK
ncbi:MAG: OmpH family outer membrane protein [Flavobacteriia bacterium]|nr:OmpH family outer membrane protein [Flavobacteriia bacterium]